MRGTGVLTFALGAVLAIGCGGNKTTADGGSADSGRGDAGEQGPLEVGFAPRVFGMPPGASDAGNSPPPILFECDMTYPQGVPLLDAGPGPVQAQATMTLSVEPDTLVMTANFKAGSVDAGVGFTNVGSVIDIGVAFPGEPSQKVLFPMPNDGALSYATTITLTSALYTQLLAGQFYCDAHSSGDPVHSFLRGQVVPKGHVVYLATLNGANAGNTSSTTGTFAFIYNPVTYAYTYYLLTSSPVASASIVPVTDATSAVQVMATPATNGVTTPGSGSLTDALNADLVQGLLDVKVSVTDSDGGTESVQGVLATPGSTLYLAPLNVAEVLNPGGPDDGGAPAPVDCTGCIGRFLVDYAQQNVNWAVVVPTIPSATVELYQTSVTGNTPLVQLVSNNGIGNLNNQQACFNSEPTCLHSTWVGDIVAGGAYVLVSGAAGQVAAQLRLPGETLLTAALGGSELNPPQTSQQVADAWFYVNVDGSSARYYISTSGLDMNSYLRVDEGMPTMVFGPSWVATDEWQGTVNAGSIDLTNPDEFPAAGGLLQRLGRVYFLDKTLNPPAVSIEGQLLAPGDTLYYTEMNGDQVMPISGSSYTGVAMAIVDQNSNVTVVANGSPDIFSGAQLCDAPAGNNLADWPGAPASCVALTPGPGDSLRTFVSEGPVPTGSGGLPLGDLASSRFWYLQATGVTAGNTVRGQFILPGEKLYISELSPQNLAPLPHGMTLSGGGAVQIVLSVDGKSFRVDGEATNLPDTMNNLSAELLFAAPGLPADATEPSINIPIMQSGVMSTGAVWPKWGSLTGLKVGLGTNDAIQINSSVYTQGEVRGQTIQIEPY